MPVPDNFEDGFRLYEGPDGTLRLAAIVNSGIVDGLEVPDEVKDMKLGYYDPDMNWLGD